MEQNITEANATLGALLRQAYQILQERVYGDLAAQGFSDIRPAHSSVFRHILPQGSRVTELAAQAQMTKQSMAYLVDYLAENGYVTIGPDPIDGRAKLVCLTEKGATFQSSALRLSQEYEKALAGAMGQDSIQQLRVALGRIPDSLKGISPINLPSTGLRRHD